MPIWSGEWWSNQYPAMFAKGTVIADIPDDITSMEDTEIKIRLTYTGVYMNGTVSDIVSKGSYKDGRVKMYAQYGGGALTYDVALNGEVLEGTYELTNPIDKGTVKLVQGEYTSNNPACIIS